MAVYLDTSAIVKLLRTEVGSAALRRWLRSRPEKVTSALAEVETVRTVRRAGGSAGLEARALRLVRSMRRIAVHGAVLETASRLDPASLRTLDAIHLATAFLVGSQVEAFVTYDRRQGAAAEAAGFDVVSPGVRTSRR